MRRRLLNIIAIASLALCVGIAALGVASFWIGDSVTFSKKAFDIYLFSNRGQIGLHHDSFDSMFTNGIPLGWHTNHGKAIALPVETGRGFTWNWHWLGFTFAVRHGGSAHTAARTTIYWPTNWEIGVPHLALVLLAGLIFAMASRHIRTDRRNHAGHCQTCGYDLRATPDRCPECGRVVKPAVVT